MTDTPQHLLDLTNKIRTSLFSWRGQFSPELVALLLSRYAGPETFVLDPFVGAGTTLFEAARKRLPCLGIEINPAAIAMAETSIFVPTTTKERKRICRQAAVLLEECVLGNRSLFKALRAVVREAGCNLYVRSILINTFIRTAETPKLINDNTLLRTFHDHCELVRHLPYSQERCRLIHGDARSIPIESGSVDLVITSPPYINVFNYHQNNRKAMEMLGWDLLTVAKSEFGSNRKNRGNRFLTVVQYSVDMFAAMKELRRVLKLKGRAIIIVGRESQVRKTSFRNGRLVAALSVLAGFRLRLRQERKFKNRFGEIIYEDILHLEPKASPSSSEMSPYYVAKKMLQESLVTVGDKDVATDIRSAISKFYRVLPSPIFCSRDAFLM